MISFKDAKLLHTQWWLQAANLEVGKDANLEGIEKSAYLTFEAEVNFLSQFIRK